MNWPVVDLAIVGPALLAGFMVVVTHVPLGRAVLNRGIIFIDLAIAQIAGLGVIAANVAGWQTDGWMIQVAAISFALLGAALLHWTDKKFAEVQEALIGVAFVLAATLSVLLLASNPHGGEQLKELLVGQILWVSYTQLWPVALLYSAVMLLWFRVDVVNGHRMLFYLVFAVVVTASVQLVGVYLVFASLIIPALAARAQAKSRQLWLAYVIGFAGYAAGLLVSAVADLPSGAVIVWSLALVGLLAAILARSFWRTG